MHVYLITFSVGLDRSISEKLVDKKKNPLLADFTKIQQSLGVENLHSFPLQTSETRNLLACLL